MYICKPASRRRAAGRTIRSVVVGLALVVCLSTLPGTPLGAGAVVVDAPIDGSVLRGADETDTEDRPADDEIPGLGEIIGSPDAGPSPEDAGDRGGWAQLGLAVALFGAVGFILRKIFREAAAGRDDS